MALHNRKKKKNQQNLNAEMWNAKIKQFTLENNMAI